MEQIAPVILILVGLLFIIIGLVLTFRVKSAAKWPSTTGTMLKSELVEHITKTKTSTNRMTSFSSYEPVVEYEYTVNGTVLKGNHLTFGLTRLPLEQAQAWVDKYPVFAEVPVFYNPKNVKESRLQVKTPSATPQLILGIVIAVVGLVWLVVTLL